MNPTDWITSTTLESEIVRLEPLTAEHARELCDAAGSVKTFDYFSVIPTTWDVAGFVRYIEHLHGPAQTVPFCVVDVATGRRVGMTTYLCVSPSNRSVEIGWTWLGPAVRGTKINPAMKRLMLAHAFEDKGAIRVQLRTDLRNLHSQGAIAKLGAVQEGTLREDKLMHDGYRRSSVFFSILEVEWPSVRDGLDARINATD
jgi:RimJ/RimL family protein N-acetyltransferase